MGIFNSLKSAKINRDFTYVGEGRYWLRIDKCKQDLTRTKIPFVAIDMTVVAVLPNPDPRGHNVHAVGDEVTRYIGAGDYFDADVAQFLTAVLGCKPEELEEAQVEAVFDPKGSQPLAGMVVEMNNKTRVVEDKENPTAVKEFSKPRFVREVPAAEALKTLPADVIKKFFPGDALTKAA